MLVFIKDKCDKVNKYFKEIFSSDFDKLLRYIDQNDIEAVCQILNKNIDLNGYMKNGNSVLHQAVLSKNLFMVQLIAKSIKPEYMDDKNFYGDSPLMISVMTNQLEITKFLVDLKCNINSTENNGATPFIAAASTGNFQMLKYLLQLKDMNPMICNKDGQTALHRAAYYGHKKIIKILIKHTKLSLFYKDKQGNLPLHLSASQLNVSCLRFMIKASGTLQILYQKNSQDLCCLDILLNSINKMKDSSLDTVIENDILEYLKDKQNVPLIKKKRISINDFMPNTEELIEIGENDQENQKKFFTTYVQQKIDYIVNLSKNNTTQDNIQSNKSLDIIQTNLSIQNNVDEFV